MLTVRLCRYKRGVRSGTRWGRSCCDICGGGHADGGAQRGSSCGARLLVAALGFC
ncbi:hypothetical protein ES332_D09G041900v1 [Gossypium tomentosum]|uniref:Uncharacterized protein n=1 Tax=Gossypium tomentosum TaxID=34277 RepID=A0A5D2JDA4_GOSTO|nr:hypothetical protein ES332_D09G041900v1 [Gossypium tomentosum]